MSFINNKVESALTDYRAMLLDNYDYSDDMAYYSIAGEPEDYELVYVELGFPHCIEPLISLQTVGEIELYELFKPMSKERANYLSSHTDYLVKPSGSVIVCADYDVLALKAKGAN